MVSFFYAGLLLLASAIAVVCMVILWKRRETPSALPLLFFMLSLFIWSLTYALHWLSDTVEVRLFWLDMTYLGVISSPPTIFIFALFYTGRAYRVTVRSMIGLWLIPLIAFVLLWTDPYHALFYGVGERPDASRVFDGGVGFWMMVFYNYVLIFISALLILRVYRNSRDIYREQARWILVAVLAPIFVNIVGFLELYPVPDADLTPLMFTVTGTIIIYTLFYKKWLDLVPIARDKVMQTMQEPFVVVDRHHRIVDLNDMAMKLYRNDSVGNNAEIIGAPITNVFDLWHSWLEQEELQGEFSVVDAASNAHVFYEWRISPIISEEQIAQGWLMLLNDITRRKLATERAFELALEKERHILLTQFIRNAAHEIRTPLTIINSTAYLMSRMDDEEQRQGKLTKVEEQVRRITKLLDMLLIMMQLDNVAIELDDWVDIREVIRASCEHLSERYTGLTVDFDGDGDALEVRGNAEYLTEVFRQLLDNAHRFSPPSGIITIRTKRNTTHQEVTIHNEGDAIPQDEQYRVFETFWRQDEAHTTEGFGVGLSITKKSSSIMAERLAWIVGKMRA